MTAPARMSCVLAFIDPECRGQEKKISEEYFLYIQGREKRGGISLSLLTCWMFTGDLLSP